MTLGPRKTTSPDRSGSQVSSPNSVRIDNRLPGTASPTEVDLSAIRCAGRTAILAVASGLALHEMKAASLAADVLCYLRDQIGTHAAAGLG